MKKLGLSCLLFMFVSVLFSQTNEIFHSRLNEKQWVDSVFNSMSLEQKVGQTIMIRSFSDRDNAYYDGVEALIKKYHVGGVCFFKGKAASQVKATNMYQESARTPLFIGIDGEHGVAMRLTDVVGFPYMMTVGATDDVKLMEEMGIQVALQCKRLGINANFIPSVDINNNMNNPVINHRSFGDDRERVAKMGIAYMKGLQSQGVLATAKHFPGHGDTGVDSHYSVPVIKHDRHRLDSLELYPFRKMINAGVWGVMIAHLNVPALDNSDGSISSRSKPIVTNLLKEELGFKGLIFTDGLEMKGFAESKQSGSAEVEALVAGNDILLLPLDTEKTFNAIMTAIRSGKLTQEEIEDKCRKILHYKYKVGLANLSRISTDNLLPELNTVEVKKLINKIFESAITVVRNQDDILPLKDISKYRIASVSIGGKAGNAFVKMMKNYAPIDSYTLPANPNSEEIAALEATLGKYNLIIADIQSTSIFASKKYGINSQIYPFLTKLAKNKSVIVNVFANPYSLTNFKNLSAFKAVICSYQDRIEAHEASAQVIFGGLTANGVLPVSINTDMPNGFGINTDRLNVLKYVAPEEVGANIIKLSEIDLLISNAISRRVFPGCQVFAAKDGKVFLNKSYGSFEYDDQVVENDDIYDLASLTKVLATTAAVMKLYDEGKINLNAKLSTYLPSMNLGDKGRLTIGDIMIHQSGLAPDITSVQKKVPYIDLRDKECYTCNIIDSVCVANYIYTNKCIHDTILKLIVDSKLRLPAIYKYSDLGFIILKDVVESLTNKSFDDYLSETFYRPLGLSTMCFNPRVKGVDSTKIVPTVNEVDFRKQKLRGDVHDQKAALLGGVAGHAGLFSNANDVGIFMQMLLQRGKYDNVSYFKPETVSKFTTSVKEKSTHRAYGFNKPYTASTVDRNPAAPCCSMSTFGHTGFTGTAAWADPKTGVVFVFLSNRVYPNYNGVNLLAKDRIRERVQQLVYEAIN